ncbi:MAG: 2,3-bisphosphoglycerate-independent phosphoglycerate mutase [Methylacidiphilales bacterium]|nr:2,3-bisphosphoglycerate-independent phosphoglycerate mutase [Candidatus Methylacidiphilales bacterium]
MKSQRLVALIIRDGWGIQAQSHLSPEKIGDATRLAATPYHDYLYAHYPMATLSASGLDVGLPEGQMGNSEVGHLNLGAGRIVYQDLTRIHQDIASKKFFRNPTLLSFLHSLRTRHATLHLWGLVSDGGVHSHLDHIKAALQAAKEAGLTRVLIHAFTDGRDTSPTGGAQYLDDLIRTTRQIGIGEIASLVGRYYAMDRDKRWERIQSAYELIFSGKGTHTCTDPVTTLQNYYAAGKTDEFIPATRILPGESPLIKDGDGIFFINFRADRTRQLCEAILKDDFNGFPRTYRPRVELLTMTEYDPLYKLPCLYPPQSMKNIFGEVVSTAGLSQLRMAETEKYPHVTYFFNGGNETPYPGEEREMVPSPKVATYDLKPEMSAYELTEAVLRRIRQKPYDVLVLNYANPDMVGHTGSLQAAIKAVEAVDACVKQVLTEVLNQKGCAIVTADHGNCEQMIAEDGSPHTAHTSNPVHILYVGHDANRIRLKNGILADVAPTLLDLLGLQKPAEMTGSSLIERK